MHCHLKKYFFILIFLLGIYDAYAQRVGLVLSGGGAKGLAHLGVLKALEEHNIPIDFITGTSMGGLVAGFYAAGYSVDEIEHIVYSEDFQNWVTGRTADEYRFFFANKKPKPDWASFNLQIDSGLSISFQPNLANDVPLNFALAEKLSVASHQANEDFNKLYVPVRVVGAEIFTQQSIAIQSGKLSNALRATMTVPFFYRPIKVDNMYLFDGGIYNNYPLDVMQSAFDADVILGINVSVKRYSEYPEQEVEKLMSSSGSLLRMMLDKPDPGEAKDNIFYLEPPLDPFSAFDFSSVREIVAIGYEATIKDIAIIKEKIAQRIDCETRAEKRNDFKEGIQPLVFSEISTEGFSKPQEKFIKSNFKKRDQSLIGISELRQSYFQLTSEDYFKQVYPEMEFDSASGRFNLKIINYSKPKLQVDFGGNLSTRNINTIYLGLNYSHLNHLLYNHHLSLFTGRFYQSAHYRLRANLPTFMPISIEPHFTFANWDYLSAGNFFGSEQIRYSLQQQELLAGADIAVAVGRKAKLKLRYAYFQLNNHYANSLGFNSNDTLDRLNLQGQKIGLKWESNNLNRKMYPTSGKSFFVTADYVTANLGFMPGSTSNSMFNQQLASNWVRLKAKTEAYTFIRNWSLCWQGEMLLSNQPLFYNYVGALAAMDQYNPLNDSPTLFLENFRAVSYLAGGLSASYPLLKNIDWRTELHAFKPIRRIFEGQEQMPQQTGFLDLDFSFAASSSVIYHSPLGPVALGINYYEGLQNPFTFMFHMGYVLFNQRIFD